jgi:CRISPR-associated protein Csb2
MSLRVPEEGRFESLVKHHKAVEDRVIGDDLPPRARQVGYQRVSLDSSVPQGEFASLLILRQESGQKLGLGQTSVVVHALRGAMIRAAEAISIEAKRLVSGHADDGSVLRNEPHLAYLPLGFVGHEHADGHLMGVALGIPKGLPTEKEDIVYRCLGSLLSDSFAIRLVMGAVGEMILEHEDRPLPPWALRTGTWSDSSLHWASVTPIVLDRMQNRRRSDPEGWAAVQVAEMCERQGLPRPDQVVVRPVSFLIGAPACRSMPPLRRKDGSSQRMVHAHLSWCRKVAGPLSLGAGRFKGYGLCKPCESWEGRTC